MGGAVALMDVEIHHGSAPDRTLVLEHPQRDREIVHVAEPFGVVGVGVVVSAPDVHRDAAAERVARRPQRATRGKAVGVDDLDRERQLRRRGAVRPAHRVEVVEVLRGVGPEQLVARRHGGLDHPGIVEVSARAQRGDHPGELSDLEDVRADVARVAIGVDDGHGRHGFVMVRQPGPPAPAARSGLRARGVRRGRLQSSPA